VEFRSPMAEVLFFAAYEGDRFHDQVQVRLPHHAKLGHVRLLARLPEGSSLDLDIPTHEIELEVQSDRPVDGLAIHVTDELDRELATVHVDQGKASLRLPSNVLGEPGPGRLKLRTQITDTLAPSLTEIPILRTRASRLTLHAGPVSGAADRGLLRGTLTDSTGPLPHRAVGLYGGDAHLATVLTDQRGAFEYEIDRPRARNATYRAVFESDQPGRSDATASLVLEPRSPPWLPPWAWLFLPTVLCGAALLVLLRKRRSFPDGEGLAPESEAPFEARGRRSLRATSRTVAGSLVDRRDGRPVSGAMVTFRCPVRPEVQAATDSEGRFRSPPIPEGEWMLEAHAPGFAPSRVPLVIPHRGQWDELVVRMASLREQVLVPFRDLVQPHLDPQLPWSAATNREAAGKAAPFHSPKGIARLADEVDRLYYGETPPGKSDLERIGEQSAELQRAGEKA
ncbi:MAG: carboxypeptidase regulatory-like domain-containing protein, partial [Myxococcales bacterium]|nr:carboxypeptidase regulatory-like domain-containing protein [Myxococcales bacterium]